MCFGGNFDKNSVNFEKKADGEYFEAKYLFLQEAALKINF